MSGGSDRLPAQARDCLAELLHPESWDRFFEEFVGRQPLHLQAGDSAARAGIAGRDPKAAILNAFEAFAPTLTCHSGSAKVPPPRARRVADAAQFEALVGEFHRAGYTVRIPDATDLSPQLRRLCRALEVVFENPADAAIFWSAAGANAPVHHDEYDLIVIQLTGRKRWFISADPPTLPNTWKTAGEGAPPMERYNTYDVAPGDVIYLPRGTAHTVDSTTESIHASIGFLPVTVRQALIAAVDCLSETDRSVRAGVTRRADDLARGEGMQALAEHIRSAAESLLEKCRSDEFVRAAMERRRARMIEDLPKLAANGAGAPQIRPDSRVRHHPLAFAQVLTTGEIVDFRQPGERFLVHRGAELALRYIAATPEFRVADLPGGLGDDVKVALVGRLVMSGFLELA